jgi:hypothetical protein
MRRAGDASFPIEDGAFPIGNGMLRRMRIMKNLGNEAFPGAQFSFLTGNGSSPAFRLSFPTVFTRWRTRKGPEEAGNAGLRRGGRPFPGRNAARRTGNVRRGTGNAVLQGRISRRWTPWEPRRERPVAGWATGTSSPARSRAWTPLRSAAATCRPGRDRGRSGRGPKAT